MWSPLLIGFCIVCVLNIVTIYVAWCRILDKQGVINMLHKVHKEDKETIDTLRRHLRNAEMQLKLSQSLED